jgi:hypothetical protein
MPTDATTPAADRRRHERFALAAPYTAVKVRRPGRRVFNVVGHAYDISSGGIRIELDKPLPAGEQVDVRVELPSPGHTPHRTVEATGHIVRHIDVDQPGPAVMAIQFLNPVAITL